MLAREHALGTRPPQKPRPASDCLASSDCRPERRVGPRPPPWKHRTAMHHAGRCRLRAWAPLGNLPSWCALLPALPSCLPPGSHESHSATWGMAELLGRPQPLALCGCPPGKHAPVNLNLPRRSSVTCSQTQACLVTSRASPSSPSHPVGPGHPGAPMYHPLPQSFPKPPTPTVSRSVATWPVTAPFPGRTGALARLPPEPVHSATSASDPTDAQIRAGLTCTHWEGTELRSAGLMWPDSVTAFRQSKFW